jgi:hypothetical protein
MPGLNILRSLRCKLSVAVRLYEILDLTAFMFVEGYL